MVWNAENGNRIGGNMITGTMNIPMTLEKANYLNALEARDEARPMVEVKYDWNGEERSYYKCPVCGDALISISTCKFCSKCGQRIDTENIEI